MHANEIAITVKLVENLVAAQFPEYADHSVRPVESSGTDNALFRLGNELVVRLPRLPAKEAHIEKEYTWLPVLAPHLPIKIPRPVALGKPNDEYPCQWSIFEWIDGQPVSEATLADINQTAKDLADFIKNLQRIDTAGGPRPKGDYDRGVPLARRDLPTQEAIDKLEGMYDIEELHSEWQTALDATSWQSDPVWIHGDLDGRNMLAKDGKLCAIIDFGSLNVGDPAYDAMVAWKIFSGESRNVFKEQLQVDEATWTRSRGIVLSQAVMILSYYTMQTNPTLCKEAQKWMKELGFERVG